MIRARRDGRVETDVPLMSIPAYSRARALAPRLRETMSQDAFLALGLYNAESQGILKVTEHAGNKMDLSTIKFYPCVVPDRGVSDESMDAALAVLNALVERNRPAPKKKAWWKFWK